MYCNNNVNAREIRSKINIIKAEIYICILLYSKYEEKPCNAAFTQEQNFQFSFITGVAPINLRNQPFP